MSATNAERAVVEAARRLFANPAATLQERSSRIQTLRLAVEDLEGEYLASAMAVPGQHDAFLLALERLGVDSVSANAYRHLRITPEELAKMPAQTVTGIFQMGPARWAQWAAALTSLGLRAEWLEEVSRMSAVFRNYYESHLEKLS